MKKINCDFISQAKLQDMDEIIAFFKHFFDPNYLFLFDAKELENLKQNIFIYKEQNKICGALIYRDSFSVNFLEFLAIKSDLKYKNIAFALLLNYITNSKHPLLKLFVDEKNEKAIKFYKRSGFSFNDTILKFYRNF
ncbi:GNAT family N-acetyltransferase [Campylobacter aviculae]|uniref:N-acetyltransferase domain-containing protein n=1 Tax=Campylobacter aviculae TaxID=2510190 RepID=A0A4U7BU25_9BACT|nr:GNAT family N-acetyltransferase [Campylobacter aviculae]TKX32836.1 hypothetical protein CQA76_02460 [Campylobacter aviculae]